MKGLVITRVENGWIVRDEASVNRCDVGKMFVFSDFQVMVAWLDKELGHFPPAAVKDNGMYGT